MPFFNSFSRALAAATLLISLGAAQQCYYPDGSPSTDQPCSQGGDSSCCGASSFCMDNGLCFGGGIVSRGSCTDKTWGSQACAGYCRTDSPSGSIAVTPCSNDGGSSTFVCGLNATACEDQSSTWSMSGGGSFVLRPAQVEALVQPALNAAQTTSTASQTTVTSCPSSEADKDTNLYTAAQMAGLGCGLGLPLLFAICAAVFLFVRERSLKRDFDMPDEIRSAEFKPPPAITIQHPAFRSTLSSRDGSEGGSMMTGMTGNTSRPETPAHMGNFMDRYQAMNEKTGRVQVHRVELDGSPVRVQRHELGDRALLDSASRSNSHTNLREYR